MKRAIVISIFLGICFLGFCVFWQRGPTVLHPVVEQSHVIQDVDWEQLTTYVVNLSAEKKVTYLFEGMGSDVAQAVESQVNQGTAFFWTGNNILLTCKHVVDDKTSKYQVSFGGEQYAVDKIWFHDDLDLAFLRVDGLSFDASPLSWSWSGAHLGDKVFVIGNVFSQYMRSLTSGVISFQGVDFNIGDNNYRSLSMIDVLLSEGSSGSPVFDSAGLLLGIVVAKNTDGMGFFLPLQQKEVLKFYEEAIVN